VILFAFGIVLSLLGSLPPGLISLSVAQTALHRGFYTAMILALGAACAEFFQAMVAVWLSDWFLQHRETERWFEWGAIPVFLVLAIHLMFFAQPPGSPREAETTRPLRVFLHGVLISAFNLLAIPYWFVYVGWLRVSGWWREGTLSTLLFSAGVTAGTMLALGCYALLSDRLLRKSAWLSRWANRIVGLLFAGMALKLLWGLLVAQG
jgi:threonine/homoserine/homoserine lactone efflux protein